MISLLDLTSLNEGDRETTIRQLCARAATPIGIVTAVCIYPQFVKLARQALSHKSIKVATVANFPEGGGNLKDAIITIEDAINDGADEIDLVMPYQAYLKGDTGLVGSFIKNCKKVCGPAVLLKVILEVGVLPNLDAVYDASRLVIANDADFIKTSTGKITIGATLASAKTILTAIKDSGRQVGFKAAGGIRTVEEAVKYIQLAETMMGKEWVTPQHFRIGASTLLDKLLEVGRSERSEVRLMRSQPTL